MAFSGYSQNLADLFEQNKQSVVTIYVNEIVNTVTGDPRTFAANQGLGSGVLIKDNIVLTASHVVANADEIMVQFFYSPYKAGDPKSCYTGYNNTYYYAHWFINTFKPCDNYYFVNYRSCLFGLG